jgi:hypothetical protein
MPTSIMTSYQTVQIPYVSLNLAVFCAQKQSMPMVPKIIISRVAIVPAVRRLLSGCVALSFLTMLSVSLSAVVGPDPTFAQSKTVPVPRSRPVTPSDEPIELFPNATAAVPLELSPQPETTPDADAASSGETTNDIAAYPLILAARLSSTGAILENGLTWRIYAEKTKPDSTLNLLAEVAGGTIQVDLPSANYVIHVGYGLASFTTMIAVEPGGTQHIYNLNAGGLKLIAEIANGDGLDQSAVKFDLYRNSNGEESEILLMADINQSRIVRVNSGAYSVVARYGSGNAIMRADVSVEPEKLTEATIFHRAAKMTLKLVSEAGGEALANTEWTVLTPGGDTVAEMFGAFPNLILVEGDYTVIARNQAKIYNRGFSVVSGQNNEVELIAAQ